MTGPMPARSFLDVLLDEGVDVVEVGDWEDHNRNSRGPWGPVHGVMIHHTVTRGSANTVAICRDGYSSLPGPLCHGVITKDGRVHVVGYGRANHAGLGDPDVLRAVIAERALPTDDEASVDGNRHFYGFECENLGDGEDPWPLVQVETIVRVIAALCRYHKWTVLSALRHLDWQPGKVDPRGPGLNWADIQARAAARLGTLVPTTPGVPQPQLPVVSLAKLVAAAESDPGRPGTPVSYGGVLIVETALVDEGLIDEAYADGHWGTKTTPGYAKWQKRCGYSGTAADGIPGRSSLVALGKKHGFRVVS